METSRRRKRGAMYFHIPAMLMAYLTYESYINYLGDRIAPEIWKKEREYFREPPYHGIEGKLNLILEKCKINSIDLAKGPYQNIVRLKHFRDYLSHGKPDKYELIKLHIRNKEPSLFDGYDKLSKFVTKEKSESSVKSVKLFIDELHHKILKSIKGNLFKIDGKNPLTGIMGHSSSESRRKIENENILTP